MEYVLETNELSKHYCDFTALNGLNMHIPKGSIYGLRRQKRCGQGHAHPPHLRLAGSNGRKLHAVWREEYRCKNRACKAPDGRCGGNVFHLYGHDGRVKSPPTVSGAGLPSAAVTNISYDLRTPLTAICGYLDLLEQEPQSEKSMRYLAVIRERTETLRSLTEELFRYSVITATADELRLEAVCMNDVLEQSLAGFYGALSARGITPEIRMPEAAVVRKLDAAALRRIFGNILSNAAKYSSGALAVSLLANGSVTFSNRAPALSRVQTERLFDRCVNQREYRPQSG